MTYNSYEGVAYWLHSGKCAWIEVNSGKRVYNIELINKLNEGL